MKPEDIVLPHYRALCKLLADICEDMYHHPRDSHEYRTLHALYADTHDTMQTFHNRAIHRHNPER